MFINRIAFALLIFRRIDATLRANRMPSLHRHNRKQINGDPRFCNADGRHQAGQTAAYHYDFRLSHLFGRYTEKGCQSYRKLIMIKIPTTLKATTTRAPKRPAACCDLTVAESPHLHRKFQMSEHR